MVEVEVTDEFREWFETLEGRLMERVIAVIDILQDRGPNLREPYCKPIKGSRRKLPRQGHRLKLDCVAGVALGK
jgi:hypothetical protein